MKDKRIAIGLVVFLFVSGCGGTPFLGAKKVSLRGGLYVERWFENPDYDFETPSGTEFYGAAAEKVRDKFIIKYYIYDDKDSRVEIPLKEMWSVHHNGKEYYEQDDNNLFFYSKTPSGTFKKHWVSPDASGPISIRNGELLPIKSCNNSGWCKLYPNSYGGLHVKKIILNKHK